LQRLARLRDEALREAAARVPADHAADEHHLAARLDAVGVALRFRPARRLQHVARAGTRRKLAGGTLGHGQNPYEASLCARHSATAGCASSAASTSGPAML